MTNDIQAKSCFGGSVSLNVCLKSANIQQCHLVFCFRLRYCIKTEPAVSGTDATETSSLTSTGSSISIAKLYEAVKEGVAKLRAGRLQPASDGAGQYNIEGRHWGTAQTNAVAIYHEY